MTAGWWWLTGGAGLVVVGYVFMFALCQAADSDDEDASTLDGFPHDAYRGQQ